MARLLLSLLFLGLAALSAEAQSYYYAYYQPAYSYYRQSYSHYDNDDSAVTVRSGSQPTVRGNRAVIRHGVAYAPENAPVSVKHAIWAANALRHKPYKWGGGHESFIDNGYDCSGTVSFALHYAGLLNAPAESSQLLSYGERGRGRWITIYSRQGHAFAIIAGLRLDTTGYYGTEGPRWHADGRDTWGFAARHPVGL